MGLDTVELVMDVEETFGIIVSDAAATEMRTVGQLHQYILECREKDRKQACPTTRIFRDIQRVLTETASLPKRAVRPTTELKDVVPRRIRRLAWKTIRQNTQWRVRDLRLPYRLGPVVSCVCLFVGLLVVWQIGPLVGLGNALLLGGFAVCVTLLLFFIVSRPLAVAFPTGMVTVGDLVHAALPPGYEEALKQEMTDQEIWEKLRKIVADNLGVKMEEVIPSARFVEDLGAG